jgi:hypothetical protein
MDSGTIRAIVNGSLGVGAAFVLADSWFGQGLKNHASRTQYLDDRAAANGIITAGTLLWPLVFDAVFGYQALVSNPTTLIGLVGPIFLGALQIGSSRALVDEPASPDESRRTEAQIVVSAALSIGILLLSREKNSPQVMLGLEAILLAVILSVTVVVPAASLGQKQNGTQIVIQSGQRVALNYAVGLVLTGVILAAFGALGDPTAAARPLFLGRLLGAAGSESAGAAGSESAGAESAGAESAGAKSSG